MKPTIQTYQIGQLSDITGIGKEAIRFYEREGLILPPQRSASGYRQYTPDTVERIRFIKRAKELGFTLREIKELLELRRDEGTTCADVKKRTLDKIEAVDLKIAALKDIKKALSKLADTCRGRGPVSECPILDHLSARKINR